MNIESTQFGVYLTTCLEFRIDWSKGLDVQTDHGAVVTWYLRYWSTPAWSKTNNVFEQLWRACSDWFRNFCFGEHKTKIRFFPKNETHLLWSAHTFVIQKIKMTWRGQWDDKKLEMLSSEMWLNSENGSGKQTCEFGKTHLFEDWCGDCAMFEQRMRQKRGAIYAESNE